MIIYKATNKINGKSYIGQTVKSLESRKNEHKRSLNDFYFIRALRKYGFDSFEWGVLEYCDSKEELDEMEFHYIKQYGSFRPSGYNMTLGGEGSLGWKPSVETKKKISNSKKGKSIGKENSFYDKKHSEETKQKMKKNHWSKHIDYSIEKHPCYGKKHSEEAKIKIGATSKGRCLGRKHTKEAITKISKAKSKTWLVVLPDGSLKIIENMSDFCNKNKLNISAMSMIASSKYKYKQHKGFKCKKLYDLEIRSVCSVS